MIIIVPLALFLPVCFGAIYGRVSGVAADYRLICEGAHNLVIRF